MEMKGIMGGFYRVSEWIMRFSVINMLWVVCSIPFFYFFGLILVAGLDKVEEVAFALLLAGIVAPFTLFPATAAVFSVARKWVMGEEDVPLLRSFFTALRTNYVQSMLGGLFYLVLAIIIIVNYRFYDSMQGNLRGVSIVFVMFFIIMMISVFNFFSILSHFHMKFWAIMKNSLLFSVGRPLTSILILVSNATVLYISLTKFTFLIPFFMGSLIAYLSFWHFYRVLRKMQEKHEAKMNEAEELENHAADTQ